jgi:hypothetical protein
MRSSQLSGPYSLRAWVRPRGALSESRKPSGRRCRQPTNAAGPGPAVEAAVQLGGGEGLGVPGEAVAGRQAGRVELTVLRAALDADDATDAATSSGDADASKPARLTATRSGAS